MHRFLGLAVALGLVLSVAVIAAEEKGDKTEEKKEEKKLTIKGIMGKAHGAKGLRARLTMEVKDGKWEAATEDSNALVGLATALQKATPKKGEKESWDKLTGEYLTAAKELAAASEKKDAEAAGAALKAIGASCGSCHKAHKGK